LRQLEDSGQDTYAPDEFARSEFDTLILGGSLEAELERGPSRLSTGVDWHHDAVEVSKSRTPSGGATVAEPGFEESRTSVGLFARERLQVAEPLAIYLGARLDYDTTFGEEFSPNAGLTLALGRTALRGSVARVYRAPTFNELFWPNGGNPDLEPESGWGAEAGARREIIPGRLSADLSLFYWQIDHKIDWRMDPVTFAFSPENIDSQETKGITLAVEAEPTRHLKLEAAYTWLLATQQNTEMDWVNFQEVTVNRRADLIPRHQVTAAAAYAWESGTRVYARLLYQSERASRFKPGEPLEPVVLVWAGASQRVGKNLELFLEAENLLDEDYSLQAGLPGDGDFPAPPLNFLGGLRVSY
jgi:outer membrane receptor protein involved in Fe transport